MKPDPIPPQRNPSDRRFDERGWRDCPTGKISQLRETGLAAQRRRFLRITAVGTVGLIAVGVTGGYVFKNALSEEPISCGEARQLCDRFITKNLPNSKMRQVNSHLGKCGSCRRHFIKQGLEPTRSV
jgi:hypothetical protein